MATTDRPFGLSRADTDLVIALACSLNEKPGSNWVQKAGSLPNYVCEVAKAIRKTGKNTSTAIAMAISRIKRWAATGEGDTKVKAVKAIAEWEALKAKSHAKSSKKVKASHTAIEASEVLVMLSKATTSTPDYSMDSIRSAWDSKRSAARKQRRIANPTTWMAEDDSYDQGYVREVWNRWLIVRSYRDEETFYRVPYSVASDGEVSFGTPSEVKQSYVDVVTKEDTDGGLPDADLKQMMGLSGPCVAESFVDLGPLPQRHMEKFVELRSSVAGSDIPSWVGKASTWEV